MLYISILSSLPFSKNTHVDKLLATCTLQGLGCFQSSDSSSYSGHFVNDVMEGLGDHDSKE